MTYRDLGLLDAFDDKSRIRVASCDECGAVVYGVDAHERWHKWGERYKEPSPYDGTVSDGQRFILLREPLASGGGHTAFGPYTWVEAQEALRGQVLLGARGWGMILLQTEDTP